MMKEAKVKAEDNFKKIISATTEEGKNEINAQNLSSVKKEEGKAVATTNYHHPSSSESGDSLDEEYKSEYSNLNEDDEDYSSLKSKKKRSLYDSSLSLKEEDISSSTSQFSGNIQNIQTIPWHSPFSIFSFK